MRMEDGEVRAALPHLATGFEGLIDSSLSPSPSSLLWSWSTPAAGATMVVAAMAPTVTPQPQTPSRDLADGFCSSSINYSFTVNIDGQAYEFALSNVIVALLLFIGPLFLIFMSLRGFRAAYRELWRVKKKNSSPAEDADERRQVRS